MRGVRWLVLVVLFFVSLVPAAAAETLHVGYFAAPGFLTRDAQGDFHGVAYSYLEALSSYAGCSFSYEEVPRNEATVEALREGELDLLVGVTGQRVPGFLYSERPLTYLTMQLSLLAGHEGDAARVGYLTPLFNGDAITRALGRVLPARQFSLRPFPHEEELMAAQEAGELDGIVDDTLTVSAGFSPAVGLAPIASYITYAPTNVALKTRLDNAASDLFVAAPRLPQQLAALESRGEAAPLLLTQEEKAYLKAHPRLSAFASPHQEPLSYFRDGRHQGVVSDIISRMESDLGVTFDVRETTANDELFRRLDDGEADVVTDFFLDYNWAHAHHMRLTVPYLTVNYVLVHRKNESVPASPIIAAPKSRNFTHAYIEKNYPKENIRYYPTDTECLRAVSRGDADICAIKSISAQALIYGGGFYRLEAGSQVVYTQATALAVRDDIDPILVRILNKEIAHLNRQEVQGFVNAETAKMAANAPLTSLIYRYPAESVTVLGLLFLVLLGVAIGVLRVRRRHMEEVTRLAYVEPLTGLHNERWWEKELAGAILRLPQQRIKSDLYLGVICIHHIEYYRSTYTRETLLESFLPLVRRLPEKFPWFLLPAISNDRTCLYFLANLPDGFTPEDAAQSIARDNANVPFGDVPTDVRYHISFLSVPRGALDVPRLIADLHAALVFAQSQNLPFVLFDQKARQELSFAARLEKLAPKALARQEFEIWYQPKYNLKTHRLVGAEALVRWQSPELGFLPPGKFIDHFESMGLAVRLDYYMLGHVQRFLKERLEAGLPIVPISVNQSALHMTERGYLAKMKKYADAYQLPAGAVDLELTETAFVDFKTKEARENSRHIIDTLRSYGFTTSMDDFCTGYSSIAMLQNLPMETMKIDRSILLAAEKDDRAAQILKNVIGLGTDLAMHVLCEGIETEEQEKLLRSFGCAYGQGFLYAKPMPQSEFEAFIESHL